jgi:hypothetical protein
MIALITERRYLHPDVSKVYNQNILEEDRLLKEAFLERGTEAERVAWDDPEVDWSRFELGIFRTTWNYFDHFSAFRNWLDNTRRQLKLVNEPTLIDWNLDKHYLLDLERAGVPIVPSLVMETGSGLRLAEMIQQIPGSEWILKPCISGAARHTYRFKEDQMAELEPILAELLQTEALLLQPFVETVLDQGEVSLLYFGGRYSHAVLKKAKAGDFRVQDDFGGTLHNWEAGLAEKKVAEAALAACPSLPVYARVDLLFQPDGLPMVSELELIEPEIWLRRKPEAARLFADSLGL